MKKQVYSTAMYLRLSRDDEDIDGSVKVESNSINSQRDIIRAFIKEQADLELYDIYIDDGFSGSDFERPDFKRMMSDIGAGKVDCVIVKDLSRFGRDYIEAGRLIQKTFPAFGVRFIAITDHYDSLTADSNDSAIILPVKNFINDSYCRDTSIKVKSHQQSKREHGECISAFAPYGYRKDEKNRNRLVIDKYAADIVRHIFRWKLEGYSNKAIADKLNNTGILSPMEYKKSIGENFQSGFATHQKTYWTSKAIRRILTNEVYLGHMIQGKRGRINYKVKKLVEKPEEEWVRVENTHQPIIWQDEYEIAQRLLETDGRISPKSHENNFFMGLLFCGDCREQMVKRSNRYKDSKKDYYICSTMNRGEGCSRHSIEANKLKEIVLTTVQKYASAFLDQRALLENLKDVEVDFSVIDQYDREIRRLQDEKKRACDLRSGLEGDLEQKILSPEDYAAFKDLYDKNIRSLDEAILNQKRLVKVLFQNGVEMGRKIEQLKNAVNLTELDRYTLVYLVRAIHVYEDKRVELEFNFADEYKLMIQINEKLAAAHQESKPERSA